MISVTEEHQLEKLNKLIKAYDLDQADRLAYEWVKTGVLGLKAFKQWMLDSRSQAVFVFHTRGLNPNQTSRTPGVNST